MRLLKYPFSTLFLLLCLTLSLSCEPEINIITPDTETPSNEEKETTGDENTEEEDKNENNDETPEEQEPIEDARYPEPDYSIDPWSGTGGKGMSADANIIFDGGNTSITTFTPSSNVTSIGSSGGGPGGGWPGGPGGGGGGGGGGGWPR